jgi:hypothetical protein
MTFFGIQVLAHPRVHESDCLVPLLGCRSKQIWGEAKRKSRWSTELGRSPWRKKLLVEMNHDDRDSIHNFSDPDLRFGSMKPSDHGRSITGCLRRVASVGPNSRNRINHRCGTMYA